VVAVRSLGSHPYRLGLHAPPGIFHM